MSAISGKTREVSQYQKKVGYFECSVVAINPSIEELVEMGIEVKEDSKMANYLGEKDDVKYVRISVWLKDVKTGTFLQPATFILSDKERTNKDDSKVQYINNIGTTTWLGVTDGEDDLPEWFIKRDFRKAKQGEEEFYNFLRNWLSKLDYREADTVLDLDFKKLIKGNMKDLKDQINGEYASTIVAMAEIRVVEDENDGVKEYQSVNNKHFLPGYTIKNLRNIRVTDEYLEKLKTRRAMKTPEGKKVYLKNYEEFLLQITDKEYGIKNHFVCEELQPYDESKNFAASAKVISADDDSY